MLTQSTINQKVNELKLLIKFKDNFEKKIIRNFGFRTIPTMIKIS